MTTKITPAQLAARPRPVATGTMICVTAPRSVPSAAGERLVAHLVVDTATGRMHREYGVTLRWTDPARTRGGGARAHRERALRHLGEELSASVAAVLAVDPAARLLPLPAPAARTGWRRTGGSPVPVRGVGGLRGVASALQAAVVLTPEERWFRDLSADHGRTAAGIVPVPVTVCSDASWSASSASALRTYGWVTDFGHGGSGLLGPCRGRRTRDRAAQAEYQGAVKALTAVVRRHPGRPVELLCDSRDALHLLRTTGSGDERVDQRLADGRIRLRWVKGHTGVPLNEAADRLCLGTRRILESGAGCPERLDALRDAVLDDLSRQLLVAGSSRRTDWALAG